MHDIKAIVADPAAFDAAMARRGIAPVAEKFVESEKDRKRITALIQEVRERRNALAKEIGIKRKAGEDTADLEAHSTFIGNSTREKEETSKIISEWSSELLASLPNVLDPDVPDGKDESDNVVLTTWTSENGRQLPSNLKQHFELLQDRMHFDTAAKLAGSRFTILTGNLARLERALGQFMLDIQTNDYGYTEVAVPLLVNDKTMFGTGQLPKFKDDLFQTTDGRWLIPTAEVSLTNMVAGEIIETLPLRFTALTDCFRAEAGSAGRDVRGMLRQHQFKKVELVSVVAPDQSEDEHERMTRCAENILRLLELTFRRVLLCAGDTGFSAAKTYDLEVYLPGQKMWREISSCSNTRAFQARRMNARTRINGRLEFVHTLNGSGLAVGRALIAVLENYQKPDGTVAIPDALVPYMGGTTYI